MIFDTRCSHTGEVAKYFTIVARQGPFPLEAKIRKAVGYIIKYGVSLITLIKLAVDFPPAKTCKAQKAHT